MNRMIFLLLLFFSTTAFSQKTHVNIYFLDNPNKPGSDTIYYKTDYKLKWSDFQGKPDPGNGAGAVASSGFAYKADLKRTTKETVINLYVFVYFSRGDSWKKPDINSAYHLNHEQRHFDITYIGAVRFYEALKHARFTGDNFNFLASDIFNKVYAENEKMQRQYDRETVHSIKNDVQAEWNKKIDQMLKEVAKSR